MQVFDCLHILEKIFADVKGRDIAACVKASPRLLPAAVRALYKSVTPEELAQILAQPLTCRTTLYRSSIRNIINASSLDSMFDHTACLPAVETYHIGSYYGYRYPYKNAWSPTYHSPSPSAAIHLERSFAPGPVVLVHYRAVAVTFTGVADYPYSPRLGFLIELPTQVTSVKLYGYVWFHELNESEVYKAIEHLEVVRGGPVRSDPSYMCITISRIADTLTELTLCDQENEVFHAVARNCTSLVVFNWDCCHTGKEEGIVLSESLSALANNTRLEKLKLGWIIAPGHVEATQPTASALRSPTFKCLRGVQWSLLLEDAASPLLHLSLKHFPFSCEITTYSQNSSEFDAELRAARTGVYLLGVTGLMCPR